MLVHLLDTSDMSDADPIHSFEIISGELRLQRDADGKARDRGGDEAGRNDRSHAPGCAAPILREQTLEFHAISAATGEGVRELVR